MSLPAALALCIGTLATLTAPLAAQVRRPPLPIPFEHSAELRSLTKPVLAARLLDDMTDPATWRFQGTGELTFPAATGPGDMRVLRVDMTMFRDAPAPTRNGLSAVNLRRTFAAEDWSAYNRLSLWVRPDVAGFPMLPLQIVLHNDGAEKVPDAYYREGIHYVTLTNGVWQQVVWEVEPLARDRVTAIEIGYWVNKMLAAAGDRVGFEIGRLELQRVEPDHHTGWNVAPGRIAYSHTGYQPGSTKTAIASDLVARDFQLIRVDDVALGDVVLSRAVEPVTTRLGSFQVMDFSDVRTPGRYVIRAGDRHTQPFRIGGDAWRDSIEKALNFLYGQRCGFHAFDSHGIDHRDWLAVRGEQHIVMNGGWHDAGDLSQGMVNTGEAVYALFALAERLAARGDDAELLERVLDEAMWGLDWVLNVRFDGGYRIGFASNNLWTNGIIGDADDRTREALNNPNVNYIAAAAAAIAHRVLKHRAPDVAARSLRVAEDDWRHAIAGVEGPTTWSTPAYETTPLELAGIGALASIELFEATREQRYADKAVELARTIVESQQKRYIGSAFPLAGFFFTGPDRQTLFHQFHRGNDQAPIVALARLIDAFPHHTDWIDWYATVALYAEYQKRTAGATAPYAVLPAYVYRDTDHERLPDYYSRYQASPEAFREQVLHGVPMGDGFYLRAFPVWFARRGNYGVLLSQAKALATAAHVRRDTAAAALAEQQAQWIIGRNPFTQSTMYGVGYDWAQQYAVSSGDFVGALPVGMQSRGITDVPYWPTQNMYVYKEVWVHPVSRWLWLMQDIAGLPLLDTNEARPTRDLADTGHSPDFELETRTQRDGFVTIRLTASGSGSHTFSLRAHNLEIARPSRTLMLGAGGTATLEWSTRMRAVDQPWVVVAVPNDDPARRRERVGGVPDSPTP
jgi:hypothetical protein